MILRLKNLDLDGAILVNLKVSNGGVPFAELESVPGFPRTIAYGETVEIEFVNCRELLYERSLGGELDYLYACYRIGILPEQPTQAAYIRPFNRVKYPI